MNAAAFPAPEAVAPLTAVPFPGPAVITEPGFYDVLESDYHEDALCETPSLSSSLARTILNASPLHAWHDHPRLNPSPDQKAKRKTMDFGKAVHAMILRRGSKIVLIDAADYKTKDAREARDAAYKAGQTPILVKDYQLAEKLVALARRQAAAYLELPGLFGTSTFFEHVAVWQEQGLWCRAMLDMVRVYPEFVAIVDFKSTDKSAAPDTIGRQVFSMGYDVQLAFYRRGLMRVMGAGAPPVRCFLMSQERTGPGALAIVELDADVLTLADKKVSYALGLWERCLTADEWPAYPPFIGTVTLPPPIEARWLEREVADDALAGAGYRFALPLAERADVLDPDVLRAG